MNKEQNSRICPRCRTENEIEFDVCWLCEIELRQEIRLRQENGLRQEQQQVKRRTAGSVAAGVGMGLAGVLAGALGGILLGILIMIVFILTVINAIFEFFGDLVEGCAPTLMVMMLAFIATIYSIFGWLFS